MKKIKLLALSTFLVPSFHVNYRNTTDLIKLITHRNIFPNFHENFLSFILIIKHIHVQVLECWQCIYIIRIKMSKNMSINSSSNWQAEWCVGNEAWRVWDCARWGSWTWGIRTQVMRKQHPCTSWSSISELEQIRGNDDIHVEEWRGKMWGRELAWCGYENWSKIYVGGQHDVRSQSPNRAGMLSMHA